MFCTLPTLDANPSDPYPNPPGQWNVPKLYLTQQKISIRNKKKHHTAPYFTFCKMKGGEGLDCSAKKMEYRPSPEIFLYSLYFPPIWNPELIFTWNYHRYVVVLTIVNSCIGMIYNYRMWRNVFGMSSTPWHPMDNSALDVRPAFQSELTHYYLTLAWVWQVSYFNPP